jgi:hypothetical protein
MITHKNNVKVVGSMKANRSQQGIQTSVWTPNTEGGESYFC